MYDSDDLEIWNLTPGGTAYAGAQTLFNVVGRVKRPGEARELWYALNGAKKTPVFLGASPRFIGAGHFNVDTIDLAELGEENVLDLWLHYGTRVAEHSIPFSTRTLETEEPRFSLDLDGVRQPEEVGQFIDGRWRLGADERGVPCLEIRPEDAGYDRLIGFGRHDWTTGYRVDALLQVTKWTRRNFFNVGLLFKWNPHLQGAGDSLPTQWSTGLAYYAAKCPGLRLRFGVNVHVDKAGRKLGSYVLQEKAIVPWKRWAGFVRNTLIRVGHNPITQLKAGVPYRFNLLVDPEVYALDIREDGSRAPMAELRVPNPPDMLPQGCVGIIAYGCALRVYKYTVSPA